MGRQSITGLTFFRSFWNKVYQTDSREYQHGSQHFQGIERIQPHCKGDDHCDDRLDVSVHTDHYGTDPFLSYGNKEISNEGGADNDIDDMPHHTHRHGRKVGGAERSEGEGKCHER